MAQLTLQELARCDREAAVRSLMRKAKIGRALAEELIAIELGESVVDLVEIEANGREQPRVFTEADRLRGEP